MNIDFVSSRKLFYSLSSILVLIALFLIFNQGINYSVEFKSGSILKMAFVENEVTKEELEKVLATDEFAEKFVKASVTEVHTGGFLEKTGKEFQITSAFIVDDANETESDKLLELEMQKTYPSATIISFDNIGPTVGEDLKSAAITSVILSIIIVLIYLGFRFDKRNAIISIIGVTHVVLIVLGLVVALKVEFSTSTIAAFLALIGYSLNDTIVIFDRIRENNKLMHKEKTAIRVNTAINQTLNRTIKTALTTLAPVTTMLLLGGSGLYSFSLVMFAGLIVGTYTSICLSAVILVDWQEPQELEEA